MDSIGGGIKSEPETMTGDLLTVTKTEKADDFPDHNQICSENRRFVQPESIINMVVKEETVQMNCEDESFKVYLSDEWNNINFDSIEGSIKSKPEKMTGDLLTVIKAERADDFPDHNQICLDNRTIDQPESINNMVVKEETVEMNCEDDSFKVYLSDEWNVSLKEAVEEMKTENQDDSQACPFIKTEESSSVDYHDISRRNTYSTRSEATFGGMAKSVTCQTNIPVLIPVNSQHVAENLEEKPQRYPSNQIESTETDDTRVLLTHYTMEMSDTLSNVPAGYLNMTDTSDIQGNSSVRNFIGTDPNTQTRAKTHKGEKPFKCTICDYKSIYKSHLNRHTRSHTAEKPYKCAMCDYRCSLKSCLTLHTRTHTGEKPYKCTICDYRCSRKSHLTAHIRTHTGEKPYKCTTCDYRCSQKFDLTRHTRTHTGEKPYKCRICEYRGSHKFQLTKHSRTHTEEKPYKCTMCDYRSSQKFQLNKHSWAHTGEKPYKCTMCDYSCSRKSQLTAHTRSHTGEKPYKCTMCDYRCSHKFDLTRHTRTHTGEKPYKCTICDFRCSQKCNLIANKRAHKA